MKRWVRRASYLYPASWRSRYAMEFEAMLDEIEIGWKDFFDILKGALTMQFTSWNFKVILLTFAAIGAVAAAAAAFRIPSEYRSTSVLRYTTNSPNQGDADFAVSDDLNDIEGQALSRTSMERLIVGLDLYKTERATMPMEAIVQQMRSNDIQVKWLRNLGSNRQDRVAFAISATYPDAKLAQAVNRELVAKFTTALARTDSLTTPLTSLQVADPPSLYRNPGYSFLAVFVFAGLCAGLLAGSAVAYALRWRIVFVRNPVQ